MKRPIASIHVQINFLSDNPSEGTPSENFGSFYALHPNGGKLRSYESLLRAMTKWIAMKHEGKKN